MINQGISDAQAVVAKGAGNSIQNFLEMAQRQEAQDHDIDFTTENLLKMQTGRQKRLELLLNKHQKQEEVVNL
jgi:type III secretion system FlhB-like substrate exporter